MTNLSKRTRSWCKQHPKKVIILVIVIIILGLWLNHNKKNQNNLNAMPMAVVKVATVKEKQVSDQFTTIGTVKALKGTDVSSSVTGKIATIDFASGQAVNKGQVLFTLENEDLVSTVKQDKAKYTYDQAQYQRYAQLVTSGTVSRAALDLNKSTMEQSKAQLEHDQALLNKTIITAPFSGTLGVVQASVGDYITEGKAIVALQDDSTLYVDFYVPERISDLVAVGHSMVATSKQSNTYQWTGTIEAINPSMDSDSRNILIRAKINKPYTNLLPGMYVDVTTVTSNLKPALVIAQQAVVYNPYGDSVYVYKEGKVQQRSIVVGNRIGSDIIVSSGLQKGEQIVISGQQKLFNGMTVQLAKDKA